MSFVVAGLVAANFILYPGFVEPGAKIETIIDKGLTLELIIGCKPQAGILIYSKVDKIYCTPTHACHDSFESAAKQLCAD